MRMRSGRLICVGIPILLTTGAFVSSLFATLSGITHYQLYLFHLDTEDLLINPGRIDDVTERLLDARIKAHLEVDADGITSKELHLAKNYDVNIFGFCWTDQDSNDYRCTDGDFDWASHYLNITAIKNLHSPSGVRIQIPEELYSAIRVFTLISRYTQVSFVIALLTLAIELAVGALSNCSRLISCITWFIAATAAIFVCIAASLATAQAAIIVGAMEATTEWHGIHGRINGSFIAAVWISFIFAVSSGLFWLLTICCCKPARSSRKME
jgi:hypothetical protein